MGQIHLRRWNRERTRAPSDAILDEILFFIFMVLFAAAMAHPVVKLPEHQLSRLDVSRMPSSSPSASPGPIELDLPENVSKLVLSIARNLEPILPPEDDDSVAVLVIEPNTGVAQALEEEYHKKRNVSRLFVLNCAIAGPPAEVDSEQVVAKFGRDTTSTLFNVFSGDMLHKEKRGHSAGTSGRLIDVARRKDWGSKKNRTEDNLISSSTVPVLSLGTLLQAVPQNVTLEID